MPSPRVPLAVVLVATFALVGCTAEPPETGDPTGGASVAPDTGETDAVSTPLEAAFERMPVGEWVSVDAATHAAGEGIGTSESVLGDREGRIGSAAQTLLISRRP